MKALSLIIAACLSLTTPLLHAQDEPAPEIAPEVVDALFGNHATIAAFTDAVQFAEQAGLEKQVLIEAEIQYYLFRNTDLASIRKLVRKIDTLAGAFDPDASRLFKSKNQFLAMGEYAKAIIALQSEDEASLKKHITEAIWLAPENAQNFASLIRSYRGMKEQRARRASDAEKAQ